jgi:hypothetical protein
MSDTEYGDFLFVLKRGLVSSRVNISYENNSCTYTLQEPSMFFTFFIDGLQFNMLISSAKSIFKNSLNSDLVIPTLCPTHGIYCLLVLYL